MIAAILVLLTISTMGYALFTAAGRKPLGTLILFMGILLSFSVLVQGCVPVIANEKMQ